MAKKSTVKKKNPQDITLRNNRAMLGRIRRLVDRFDVVTDDIFQQIDFIRNDIVELYKLNSNKD
jgi:hypothetical protein